jgi:hypothetical protein
MVVIGSRVTRSHIIIINHLMVPRFRSIRTLSSYSPAQQAGQPAYDYATKYPEAEWVALVHLLERLWFTRTWVIQEVALATHAEIVCGDATLGWDTLERVID